MAASIEVPASEDESRDDVFEIAIMMRIKNPCLGVDVAIHPSFIQVMDDDSHFVLLDFYQSRGVYSLLSSRLPRHSGRHHGKLLAKVIGD